MVLRLMSRPSGWAALAFVIACLLPITISPNGEIRASSLCGSALSTCCRDPDSACAGVSDGVGWYDTGCVGKCSGPMICPFPIPPAH